MFSILILTGNEELNIRECLESVSWCDDVWVLRLQGSHGGDCQGDGRECNHAPL